MHAMRSRNKSPQRIPLIALILLSWLHLGGTSSQTPSKIPRHGRESLDASKSSRSTKLGEGGARSHTAGSTEPRIYVLGGMCNALLHTAIVESYVPGHKEWRSEPCMTRVRAGCAAVSLGGKLWVMGGHDNRCTLSHSKIRYLHAIQPVAPVLHRASLDTFSQ
jgi:hypothetical protein